MTSTEVHDSPTGWVAKHIDSYVASEGEEGHLWRGFPTLLLTTTGRKSGARRRTALIYGQHGDDYIIVASLGGADHHPLWYLNLTADPSVELQVLSKHFSAVARTATEAEKPELWSLMAGVYPPYDEYQAKTDRVIPVVILTPTSPISESDETD